MVRARYDERDLEGRAIRPKFFAHVARRKGYYDAKKKNYKRHMAPMDYVQDIVDGRKNSGSKYRHASGNRGTCSIGEIIDSADINAAPRTGYVDLVLNMVRDMDNKTRMMYQTHDNIASVEEKRRLTSVYFNRCIECIKAMKLNNATMLELLIAMDAPENNRIRRKLWSILFGALDREFSSLLIEAKKPVHMIEECAAGEDGDVKVFWLNFRYVDIA